MSVLIYIKLLTALEHSLLPIGFNSLLVLVATRHGSNNESNRKSSFERRMPQFHSKEIRNLIVAENQQVSFLCLVLRMVLTGAV